MTGPRNRGDTMKATELLHNLGQSIWLDNITRDLLESGTLQRYIDEFSVTGLTSNPTIFDQAIKNSSAYDTAIRDGLARGKTGEALFFDLALADITRAADLFRPIYDRTRRHRRRSKLELWRRGPLGRSRGGEAAKPAGKELSHCHHALAGCPHDCDGRRSAAHPAW